MDQFGYLIVLVSIITGLGITHLLTGLGRFLGGPNAPRVFWVQIVCAATKGDPRCTD